MTTKRRTYDILAEVPRDRTSYRYSGVTPGTQYWYLVIADEANYYDDPYAPYVSDYAIATTASDASPSARMIAPLRVSRPTGKVPRLTRLRALRSRPIRPLAKRPVQLNRWRV